MRHGSLPCLGDSVALFYHQNSTGLPTQTFALAVPGTLTTQTFDQPLFRCLARSTPDTTFSNKPVAHARRVFNIIIKHIHTLTTDTLTTYSAVGR
jgi:hypothetical protein